jgi:large subunit ribosomal protein L32e
MEKKLQERKERKGKKPTFIRQDANKKPSLPQAWRKPRGRQSKMRLNKRGYNRTPSTGWSSPSEVKGLSPEGLLPVVVATVAELERLDAKQHGLVLSATLGNKKRELLLTKAKEKGLKIINVKDVEAQLKELSDKVAARKKVKADRDVKKAEKEKKSAKEKSIEETVVSEQTPEEQKKAEEAEKQKILAHKE